MNWKKIEEKWVKKWQEAKIFEYRPDKRKKSFVTFPYPYINLFPHIGHFYSLMRVETYARYRRMTDHNVLFAQAWHCTGSPIINAARRVSDGEEKQISTLRQMGFNEEQIEKFKEPKQWIKIFSKGWQDDLTDAGLSIDWRRNFITTSLNPHYSKFIEWQFRTLKKKGYVIKGKKPVIWCPRENMPIGDHSRVAGEGETPQEYTLLKFKFEDAYIVCASLRPETIYGQTNLWVDPKVEYVKIRVDDKENWICSKECADKLKLQDKKVEEIGKVNGGEIIGKYAYAPGIDKELIILPSSFCNPDIGSGIVTSVPSDAPDDYMGLTDLQNSKEECEKYGLNWEDIKKIEVIPIIKTKEWGDMAGVKICLDRKIKNQKERAKLEEARKIIYKAGYHTGIMTKNSGGYAGMKVEVAKEKIKSKLIKEGRADVMYEPTGKVICRCLTEAKVKIVSDQWFLAYGNNEWKKLAHKCLNRMNLYPEKVRPQFDYVLDWLDDWACTHESETDLGTPLPWDKKWVIESLSDSTIYMAYYTISHKIKDIDIEKIDDNFFDYVFLGKNKDKSKVGKKLLEELREEFLYWYPMDFRNTGKDLIQNHMSFCIFNHTAIFPEKHWPESYGLNGWVTVDGQKMSKSLGNVIPVRVMVSEFGADASRFTVLSGGEGLDDANWDTELARAMKDKLTQLINFAGQYYNRGIYEKRTIDRWMLSQINLSIKDTTKCMEQTMFRSALQRAYFDMQRIMRWYLRRTAEKPNKEIMNKAIETQVLLLAPFIPFTGEEVWSTIGKKGFICGASWPKYDKNAVDKELDVLEKTIENVVYDINEVLKLIKIKKPKQVKLIVSENWKYELYKMLQKQPSREFKDLMQAAMRRDEFKKHSKEIAQILQKIMKAGKSVEDVASQEKEYTALVEARDFISSNFSRVDVVVEKGEKSKERKRGMPGKPGIVVI
ncbi:leucine--tRNA ligase [Candidatus Woesearchaeota archaeon]|nr:leucine--tRNA ligase [Candidatus Woesearchaeota archaeon]